MGSGRVLVGCGECCVCDGRVWEGNGRVWGRCGGVYMMFREVMVGCGGCGGGCMCMVCYGTWGS
jgi:hypothetical protein